MRTRKYSLYKKSTAAIVVRHIKCQQFRQSALLPPLFVCTKIECQSKKPISMTDLVTSERKVFAVGSRHEPVTVVDSVSQTSKKPKPNFRRTYETAKNTQNGDFRLIWQCRTFSYIVMRNVTQNRSVVAGNIPRYRCWSFDIRASLIRLDRRRTWP